MALFGDIQRLQQATLFGGFDGQSVSLSSLAWHFVECKRGVVSTFLEQGSLANVLIRNVDWLVKLVECLDLSVTIHRALIICSSKG